AADCARAGAARGVLVGGAARSLRLLWLTAVVLGRGNSHRWRGEQSRAARIAVVDLAGRLRRGTAGGHGGLDNERFAEDRCVRRAAAEAGGAAPRWWWVGVGGAFAPGLCGAELLLL